MPRILVLDRNQPQIIADELKPFFPQNEERPYAFDCVHYPYEALELIRTNTDTPYRAVIAGLQQYRRLGENRSQMDALMLAAILQSEGRLKKTSFVVFIQHHDRREYLAAFAVGALAFKHPRCIEDMRLLGHPLRQAILQHGLRVATQSTGYI